MLREQWGNPSSVHRWGQRAALALETARDQVAALINAPTSDCIIFTSSGTEADNLALWGVARRYEQPQHLIISQVEHSAVAKPAAALEAQGWQVTRLGVDAQGRVSPEELVRVLQENTVLISIIYGQSEIGTLQPLDSLSRIAQEQGILFHTDAVQVAGRLPINVQSLGVDLLSLSSHKIYGLQGAGALYVRQGIALHPLIFGGGQERGMRSGTPSVPTLATFGLAAELARQSLQTETPRLRALRDRLFTLLADSPFLKPTGDRLNRLPHHLSFIITPREADHALTGKTLVRRLNLAGIGISSGSACQSGQLQPSAILQALGYSESEALRGIRLSLGRETTPADIDWTATVLQQHLAELC
jgi:cysteine desulfurase